MRRVVLFILTITMILVLPLQVCAKDQGSSEKYNPNSFPHDIDLKKVMSDTSQNNEARLQIEEMPNSKKLTPRAFVNSSLLMNRRPQANSSAVATMRIFAISDGGSSSFNTSGHVFLSIENLTSGTLLVGGLSVPSGMTITVGTWGNKTEHKGLWYNLEGYFQSQSDVYQTAVSMRVDLQQDHLDFVSKNIKKNDSWSYLSNCSTFATKIWNSICNATIKAGYPNTPTATVSSIKQYKDYYQTGVGIPYFGAVYYGEPPVLSPSY